MYENNYESQIADNKDDKNELMNKGVTDLNRWVFNDKLCQLCRLPKIGNNLVRPNGLRECNCDKVLPYHNRSSSFPSTSLDDHGPVSFCPKESHSPHHPEINITENLASPQNDIMCRPKSRTFVPSQGMDTGECPRALFYQYYPNRNKSYTFNLLPLPFTEKLKYQEMRALSMMNGDIKKKWKNFLYNLPDSELRSISHPDDKFWRWQNYLRYKPDESKNEFRKKMQTGPKYDNVGRLPITGEELKIFRKFGGDQSKPNILRKGDGTWKNESHKIISKQC